MTSEVSETRDLDSVWHTHFLLSPSPAPAQAWKRRNASRNASPSVTVGARNEGPLAGSLPPFVNGISKYPRPIVATGIRLFIGYTFTGEYTARFRPRSFDCQCVEPLGPLQTAHHVIAACPLHAELRRQFLLPTSSALSRPSLERRNEALGDFLATS